MCCVSDNDDPFLMDCKVSCNNQQIPSFRAFNIHVPSWSTMAYINAFALMVTLAAVIVPFIDVFASPMEAKNVFTPGTLTIEIPKSIFELDSLCIGWRKKNARSEELCSMVSLSEK